VRLAVRTCTVVALAAAGLVLPACGEGLDDAGYTPLRAAQLTRQVDDVREAAARGDTGAARVELERVREAVDEHAERGDIGDAERARVRDAIRAAEEQLR